MIGAALLVAASAATAVPPTAAARAAQVFEQVCVDGSARFAPGEIEPTDAGDIPADARRLALFVLWFEHREQGTPTAGEMPSRVYRLDGKDEVYLAVADAKPTNQLQASCIVFTQDSAYDKLAALAATMTENPPADIGRSNAMVSFPLGDHRVFVAQAPRKGWALIAALPLQLTLYPEASK